MPGSTAADVIAALEAAADPNRRQDVERVVRGDEVLPVDRQVLGVRMGTVFAIAKQHMDMPLADIETLLDGHPHEVRVAGVSVMDFQARAKRTSVEDRKALYDLYLRRHDRINNWDLVDRSAPYVVGGYLADRPRDPLYALARSANPWERRTAIVATAYFLRTADIDDTFAIAEILASDPHDLIQLAVGSWIRTAGTSDEPRLLDFLDRHRDTMSADAIRYAVEKLAPEVRARYLKSRST